MPSESLSPDRFPRRAFVVTPIALCGLAAAFYLRPRTLPDGAQDGSGPRVELTLFSQSGNREAVLNLCSLRRDNSAWRRELTGEEFAITRRKATEFAFSNRYWNTHQPGMYRCVCCGTALFRSQDKFDSGTGWPSFSAPAAQTNIYTAVDSTLGVKRVEVLCRKCDAHLGHVFDDGPAPSGLRYCLNSGALRFVTYS